MKNNLPNLKHYYLQKLFLQGKKHIFKEKKITEKRGASSSTQKIKNKEKGPLRSQPLPLYFFSKQHQTSIKQTWLKVKNQ